MAELAARTPSWLMMERTCSPYIQHCEVRFKPAHPHLSSCCPLSSSLLRLWQLLLQPLLLLRQLQRRLRLLLLLLLPLLLLLLLLL